MNGCFITGNTPGRAVLLRGGKIGGISVYFEYVKLEIPIIQPSGDVKLYSSGDQLSVGARNNFGSG